MIKINLLPFRAARKRENVRRQVSIYFLCMVFLFSLMAYLYFALNGQLNQLEAREKGLREELKSYEAITKEISKLRKDTKDLNAKLVVIQNLEKQRGGPVQLLVEIARAVPFDRLWLDSIMETRGKLTLRGTAMDNDTVALFMTDLEQSPHIHSVDLNSTSFKYFPEFKRRTASFALTCRTAYAAPEPEQKKPKKQGRR